MQKQSIKSRLSVEITHRILLRKKESKDTCSTHMSIELYVLCWCLLIIFSSTVLIIRCCVCRFINGFVTTIVMNNQITFWTKLYYVFCRSLMKKSNLFFVIEFIEGGVVLILFFKLLLSKWPHHAAMLIFDYKKEVKQLSRHIFLGNFIWWIFFFEKSHASKSHACIGSFFKCPTTIAKMDEIWTIDR